MDISIANAERLFDHLPVCLGSRESPQLLSITATTNATRMFSSVEILTQHLPHISQWHHLSTLCVCVCQVAGREYTQWDDFRVDGRRDGGRQEMTLEDLFSHIKVAAPSSPQPENTPTLSSHPARLNAYFSVTVFRWALLPSCQRRQSSLFKKKKKWPLWVQYSPL